MIEIDMTVVFYTCTLTSDLFAVKTYLFDKWDGFEAWVVTADWQNNGSSPWNLCVDLHVVIDGYQTLDYIYKGMYVCVNDFVENCGIHSSVGGGTTAYQLYFNHYVDHRN